MNHFRSPLCEREVWPIETFALLEYEILGNIKTHNIHEDLELYTSFGSFSNFVLGSQTISNL